MPILGSNMVIKLISVLDKLDLLGQSFKSFIWDFADPTSSMGKILEALDAKLCTDEVYRT